MTTPYYADEAVTLYHGCCLDVLPQVGMVDHVITDPPYSRDVYVRALGHNTHQGAKTPDRLYKGAGLAKLAAGDIGHVDALIEPVALLLAPTVRRWLVVFSDVEGGIVGWRAALTAAGLRYVRTGAWVKPNVMPQMSGDRPAVGFEPCTICHALGPMRWNGGGRAATWIHSVAQGASRPDHPCPKPEPLMAELVALFTDPGEMILDPFAGSGTTLHAAKRLGRKAIGIEINEGFCEVAARRLSQGALPLEFTV